MAKKNKSVGIGRIGRVEREQKNVNIVRFVMFTVVIVTVVAVVVGSIMEFVVIPEQPVVTVNGTQILTKDFQTRVRYERAQTADLFNNYLEYYNTYIQNGIPVDPGIEQTLNSLYAQLENNTVAENAFRTMIDDVLIAQEAEKMGISISDEEIQAEVQKAYGYFPDGSPTPAATPFIDPVSTLSATQIAIITLTPTAEELPTETPTTAPTLDPEITVTATNFPFPTATSTIEVIPPTPTEFTKDAFQDRFTTEMAGIYDYIQVTEDSYRQIIGSLMLRQKMYEELTKDFSTEQEHIWIRHIVVDNEKIANDVLALLAEGQDWNTIAQELSTDAFSASTGGDIGWRIYDTVLEPYAEVLREMEIGDISVAVEFDDSLKESGKSWAIIQLLGKENRTVDADILTRLKQNFFSEWLSDIREEAEIIEEDYWLDRAPNEPILNIPPTIG